MTENEKYVYDTFMNSIKSGFNSLESVIDEALEVVEDEGLEKDVTEEWLRETIGREYNKYISATKTWQHPTDCDKLISAFDELIKEKIVALHIAGFTQEDSLFDVKEVWEDLEDIDIHPIGYCYYNQQDMERAIADNVLAIGFYGKKEKNDKEAIVIGNKIVAALKNAGFEVKWDNTSSKRIEIEPFVWHNEYISDEDVEEKWGYDRVNKLMTE